MKDKGFLIVVVILMCAIGLFYGYRQWRGQMVVTEKNFKDLPMQIGQWQGEERPFSDEIYDELRADENLSRVYTRESDGAKLGLYIGYYGTQRGGHPEHVPTGCYPGAGWIIHNITPLDITNEEMAKTITVNNLYAELGDLREQTLYWLQNFRGNVAHTGWRQQIEKIKTLLKYNRNDGAFIRVNATVTDTREATIAYQKDFIKKLMPLLPKHWPKEEKR